MPVQPERGFNISSFKSWQNSVSHLRNNNFIVVIPYPTGLARTNQELLAAEQNLELACDTVNFPSCALQTYPVQRYSYGAVELKPTINAFSPLNCTFICDRGTENATTGANIHKFFHEWVKIVANYDFWDSITGTSTSGVRPYSTYEIGYKPEYSVDLFLHIYDEHGVQRRHMRFREAYPIVVGDIQLAWGRLNDVIRIPVTFTFFDMSDMDLHGQ